MTRVAAIERKTGETEISLLLNLDPEPSEIAAGATISTGIGFFDHMLELLARHGRLGLEVRAVGDLETGSHHTVEDVGIAFGQALDEALGDRARIRRYADKSIPMDEALADCAIDISGRGFCRFEANLPPVSIAGYEVELTEEFFRALATNAKLTLHINARYGTNAHHIIEGCFKAFARTLREAVSLDPSEAGVPSTKGTLSS